MRHTRWRAASAAPLQARPPYKSEAPLAAPSPCRTRRAAAVLARVELAEQASQAAEERVRRHYASWPEGASCPPRPVSMLGMQMEREVRAVLGNARKFEARYQLDPAMDPAARERFYRTVVAQVAASALALGLTPKEFRANARQVCGMVNNLGRAGAIASSMGTTGLAGAFSALASSLVTLFLVPLLGPGALLVGGLVAAGSQFAIAQFTAKRAGAANAAGAHAVRQAAKNVMSTAAVAKAAGCKPVPLVGREPARAVMSASRKGMPLGKASARARKRDMAGAAAGQLAARSPIVGAAAVAAVSGVSAVCAPFLGVASAMAGSAVNAAYNYANTGASSQPLGIVGLVVSEEKKPTAAAQDAPGAPSPTHRMRFDAKVLAASMATATDLRQSLGARMSTRAAFVGKAWSEVKPKYQAERQALKQRASAAAAHGKGAGAGAEKVPATQAVRNVKVLKTRNAYRFAGQAALVTAGTFLPSAVARSVLMSTWGNGCALPFAAHWRYERAKPAAMRVAPAAPEEGTRPLSSRRSLEPQQAQPTPAPTPRVTPGVSSLAPAKALARPRVAPGAAHPGNFHMWQAQTGGLPGRGAAAAA